MSLKERFIEGWSENGLAVKPLMAYSSNDHHMLLNPECGSTVLINSDLMDMVLKKNLTEDVAFLLIQRGMASYDESRQPFCVEHPKYPHFFMLDLTQNCNLNCRYCFRELSKNAVYMTNDMLLKICEKLAEYWRRHPENRLHIQAWGGEPLLRLEQIEMMRQFFDERGMDPNIEIETNGTLINDRTAEKLRSLRIHVGVSVDGDPAVQNVQRPDMGGNPTSERIEAGIRSLRKYYGDEFGSITVVTRNTAERLHEILDYFINVLHLTGIKFNPLRETGKGDQLSLSEEELAAFVKELLEALVQYIKAGVKIIEQNISQRLRNIVYRPCDNICNACGCQGGFAMVTIDHNGDVFPCEMSDFEDMKIGNIQTETIEEMVSALDEGSNRYFAARKFEQCKECPWRFYCRGGCKSAVIFAAGSTQAIDETECIINRTLYPLLIELLLKEPDIARKLMGMN